MHAHGASQSSSSSAAANGAGPGVADILSILHDVGIDACQPRLADLQTTLGASATAFAAAAAPAGLKHHVDLQQAAASIAANAQSGGNDGFRGVAGTGSGMCWISFGR